MTRRFVDEYGLIPKEKNELYFWGSTWVEIFENVLDGADSVGQATLFFNRYLSQKYPDVEVFMLERLSEKESLEWLDYFFWQRQEYEIEEGINGPDEGENFFTPDDCLAAEFILESKAGHSHFYKFYRDL